MRSTLRTLLGAVAVVAVVSSNVQAAEAELGTAVVITDNSDHFDTGVGLSAFVGVRPAPVITLRGTLLAWDADVQSDVLHPGSFTAVGVEASLLLNLDVQPAIHLWAGGGIGGYGFESYDEDWNHPPYGYDWQNHDTIDDAAGYHLLVGGDVIIAGAVSMFLEAKALFLDTEATTRVAQHPMTGPGGAGPGFTETTQDITLDTALFSVGLRVRL